MKPTFYTAYHKIAPHLQSTSVTPIHVGRALSDTPLPNMIGDDTGENISDRNGSYCELTALYWAWKNDTDSSHIGLLHYRRVFDLAGDHDGATTELFLGRFDIDPWLRHTEAWLAANPGIDVVLPVPHVMGRTVRDNYANRHEPADFNLARDIVATRHPDYLAAFDAVAADRTIYLGNMFLMRRDLFQDYCAWLFDILERVETADRNRDLYSVDQWRYLGFLSERLMTVFINKLRADRPDLDIREVRILNMSQAMVVPYVSDGSLNGAGRINVAFAADRAYLPHTAAMLRSLLDHVDPDRPLDLFFLQSDVPAKDLALLREVVDTNPRATLHEIPVGNVFASAYRSRSRAPSNATYNRFLLFDLLPTVDRLLYLDTDIIVMADIGPLFDTDMNGAQIGAVTDHIMTRTLTGPTHTVDPDAPELSSYHRGTLGLSDEQIGRYFNAGVLLFDFSAMDVAETGAALMRHAETGRFLFRDQDILNMHFRDSLHVLPDEWNVFNTIEAGYGRVPRAGHARAMAARKAPALVHYAAGDYKPWTAVPVPFAHHYWNALIRTPFYAEVVRRLRPHGAIQQRATARDGLVVRSGRTIAERFPALRPALLRTYALLRRS